MTTQYCSHVAEYTVYSYDYPQSEKKGQVWRQHGVSDSLEEAIWIAEQLKSCDTIERIEIQLRDASSRTSKTVKVLDKEGKGFWKWFKSAVNS